MVLRSQDVGCSVAASLKLQPIILMGCPWGRYELAEAGSSPEQKSHLQSVARGGLKLEEKPLSVFRCGSLAQDLMAAIMVVFKTHSLELARMRCGKCGDHFALSLMSLPRKIGPARSPRRHDEVDASSLGLV